MQLDVAVNRQDAARDAGGFVMRVMQRYAAALDVRRRAGFLAGKRKPGAHDGALSDHSEKRCNQAKGSKTEVPGSRGCHRVEI